MARGVNKVILIGNLGNDPDMRAMPSGDQMANISLATSETWNDKNTGEKREKTEWHRVVAFGRLAEIIGQYCRKGSKVYVEGRLQTRKWTDAQGVEKYTTEILINDLQMLDSRSGGSAPFDAGDDYYGAAQPANNAPVARQSQYGQQNYANTSAAQSAAPKPAPSAPVSPQTQNFGPNTDNIDEGFDDDIPF